MEIQLHLLITFLLLTGIPGAIALTRILCSAYSRAAAFVSPANACFEEQYAVAFGLPIIPDPDDTFTTAPPFPCSNSIFTSSRKQKYVPSRFTEIVFL